MVVKQYLLYNAGEESISDRLWLPTQRKKGHCYGSEPTCSTIEIITIRTCHLKLFFTDVKIDRSIKVSARVVRKIATRVQLRLRCTNETFLLQSFRVQVNNWSYIFLTTLRVLHKVSQIFMVQIPLFWELIEYAIFYILGKCTVVTVAAVQHGRKFKILDSPVRVEVYETTISNRFLFCFENLGRTAKSILVNILL